MMSRISLRLVALAYLGLLVLFPVGWILWEAFGGGIAAVWNAASNPAAVHALILTLVTSLVAVCLNTVFGVVAALMVVRHPFPGVRVINALVDLPLALSPVVVGLCLLLLYGETGWLGGWLQSHGITVMFALPAMILATTFVTLPFVIREVVPVVREVGTRQEEAARTLGASTMHTFWSITLPSIRAGVVYGVVLTMARALGEFGAISVVAGNITGVTQTLTMYVDAEYTNFDARGAYVASVELALLAVTTLVIMNLVRRPRDA
jgi:sulfate transport system permease protein